MNKRGEAWVLAQFVLLIALLLCPAVGPAWVNPAAFGFAGSALMIGGLLLGGWSALALGSSLTPFPRPRANARLVRAGPYRMIRHPIYTSVLAVALGFALATMSPLRVVLVLVLFIFFDLKSRREECWLEQRYPEYAAYRDQTKRLLPLIY